MFVSTAYAQAAEGASAGSSIQAFLPLILIFVVFYFLLIRPQAKKQKQHKEMLAAVQRGDKVVTGGGILGRVTKSDDEGEVTVEIAEGVKVKVRRDLIAGVVAKPQPVGANKAPANDDGGAKSKSGFSLRKLLGVPDHPDQNEKK